MDIFKSSSLFVVEGAVFLKEECWNDWRLHRSEVDHLLCLSLSCQTRFFFLVLVLVLIEEDDPAFQKAMVEGGGVQRAVVDLLVEQVTPTLRVCVE